MKRTFVGALIALVLFTQAPLRAQETSPREMIAAEFGLPPDSITMFATRVGDLVVWKGTPHDLPDMVPMSVVAGPNGPLRAYGFKTPQFARISQLLRPVVLTDASFKDFVAVLAAIFDPSGGRRVLRASPLLPDALQLGCTGCGGSAREAWARAKPAYWPSDSFTPDASGGGSGLVTVLSYLGFGLTEWTAEAYEMSIRADGMSFGGRASHQFSVPW